MPDISDLDIIWDIIFVLWFSTHTVFTVVSSGDAGSDSSLVMISS